MSENPPDRQKILEMVAGWRVPCVIGAAAELDLFTAVGQQPATAEAIAGRLTADPRATRVLLDALAALGLLDKEGELYGLPSPLRPLLMSTSPDGILPMIWHTMTILRNWSQLARVVKSGTPAQRQESIRGAEADRAAFVAAMHTVSGPNADAVLARLGPPKFKHLLDVGGASGTWTIAFLRTAPGAYATLFDLPDAIEQARQRISGTEFAERVRLVPGDFYRDELPQGADYAWVSAIIHQHSRQESRELFAKVFRALQPGGRIGIRDLVMDATRTRPLDGALFAINMLVATPSGGTYTFDEIAEDLQSAGFVRPRLSVASQDMNSVIEADRP